MNQQEEAAILHLSQRFESIGNSLEEIQSQVDKCFLERKNRKKKQKESKNVPSEQLVLTSNIPFVQKGTGLHIDSWPYNLWAKLKPDYTFEEFDRFRPFQSMLCLTDGHEDPNLKEGGLELVPGFQQISEEYFPATDRKFRDGKQMRSKAQWVSPYHLGLDKEEDVSIHDMVRKIKRIPKDWEMPKGSIPLPPPKGSSVEEYLDFVRQVVKEHDTIPYEPIRKGDFVFFDIRIPHQNSNSNMMNRERSVFYHAFLMAHPMNLTTIESLKERRRKFEHPEDFNSKFKPEQKVLNLEKDLIPLSTLGKYIYNEEAYPNNVQADEYLSGIIEKYGKLLTEKHVKYFQRYGYVVVENLINDTDCDQLLNELKENSKLAGCSLDEDFTKSQFKSVGGGFGAMLEFYYLTTQQKLRMDEKLYAVTVNLLSNTWCSNSGNEYQTPYDCPYKNQINPAKLWLYIDRMNFRKPDKL